MRFIASKLFSFTPHPQKKLRDRPHDHRTQTKRKQPYWAQEGPEALPRAPGATRSPLYSLTRDIQYTTGADPDWKNKGSRLRGSSSVWGRSVTRLRRGVIQRPGLVDLSLTHWKCHHFFFNYRFINVFFFSVPVCIYRYYFLMQTTHLGIYDRSDQVYWCV